MRTIFPRDTKNLSRIRKTGSDKRLRWLTMTASVLLVGILTLSGVIEGQPVDAQPQNNYPNYGPVPSDYNGPRFKLRQDYPGENPAAHGMPPDLDWLRIDPAHSAEFLQAAVRYCFDGNTKDDFRVENIGRQSNDRRRRWYHAPYMHAPALLQRGREGIHGLTNERFSRPGELSGAQTKTERTYAVAFYNDIGASELGRVWNVASASATPPPRTGRVNFPKGSVCFKLIFTTALPETVRFLERAPEWQCYGWIPPTSPQSAIGLREEMTVRLLQVDIAVKVSDTPGGMDAPGWVFGTLQYDASVPNQSPWHRLTPVSLMWGESQVAISQPLRPGGKKWPMAKNTWINTKAPWIKYRINSDQPISLIGGANGPVDNPTSSCMHCHRRGATSKPVNGNPLDYSLQLAYGVRRYNDPQNSNLRSLFRSEDITREKAAPVFAPLSRPGHPVVPRNRPR